MEDHTESGFSADRSRGGRLSTLKATSCLPGECVACASSPSAPVSGIICYEICALSLSYRSVGRAWPGSVGLYYTILCGNDIRRRVSIATFSFLPAFPTEYTTNGQEWWKGERRQHFNIVNMTKRNQSWHDIPSEAACLWTASPSASIFSKWSIKRPTPNPLPCLGGSPCLCVSFPNLIPFSSCKWLRPEACVYFCHCSDCNMCQSQSQYHTPVPSPSPLCRPLALPCLRTNLIEVSLSIFTLVFY